jgi:vancomycin resistance protein YoaR
MYIGKSFREVVGGGISQVASTLYNCTLMADLEILERHSHSYVTSFIDAGFDAEVYYGLLDFRFRNNTEQPIRIDVAVSNSKVTINIIGTDSRDYTVEILSVIDKTKEPITIYNTMTKDNPNGYLDGDILVQAVTGYDISTYMRRYSKMDGTLLSETLIVTSVYSKLDEVVVRIEDGETPVDPTDPTVPTDPTTPSEPSLPVE